MANPLQWIIGPVIETVGGIVQRRQERKSRQDEMEQAIHLKKLERVEAGQIAEVKWNERAMTNAGWVTDWVTILLSLPLVLSFVPDAVPVVKAGFEALEEMPDYYRAAIGLMIGFAYGYRKYADWQMSKHYTLPNPMDKIG